MGISCGGWIRTTDLRVMGPTSYRTAPPRNIDEVYNSNRVAQKLIKSIGFKRAGNGTRTRDILLGRQELYQLSYSRISGQGRIRTSVGVCQQIYSLPPLTTWVPALATKINFQFKSRRSDLNG